MTYDYQKLKYSEMAQYCVENEDKLMKNKKEEYLAFIQLLNKDKKKNTLGAKKAFYNLVKDEKNVEFVNVPSPKKAKKVDKDFEAIEALIKKYCK